MDVDFGVEVAGPFEGEGEVRPARTPAGEVARTVHAGPYDRIKDAHDAIHAWSAATGAISARRRGRSTAIRPPMARSRSRSSTFWPDPDPIEKAGEEAS